MSNKTEEIRKKFETYPDILYKYRDWSDDFHKKLIKENQIFFPSAKLLNDPFDAAIPLRFEKLSKKEIEKFYFETTKRNYPYLNRTQRIAKTKEVTQKALKNKDKLFAYMREYQLEKNRRDFGIYSLTKDKSNIVMWSHYSNSHKGFCVGFNLKNLYQFIIKVGVKHKVLFDIFEVHYENYYPIFIPSKMNTEDFIVKPLITKSDSWKYEDEYRLLLISDTNLQVNLPKDIIVEVILGCNISDQNRSDIISVLQKKNENINLFQARMSDYEFKLEFDQIDYRCGV